MALKEQILNDLKEAMKAQDALTLGTLRMIKTEIMNFEVSGANKVADDDTVITILKKGVKQRKEAAEGFDKGGNSEFAQKERDEITVIEKYLPEQMPEDQVRTIVEEVIAATGASSMQDMGKVMGAVMAKTGGQADGTLVNQIVKSLLT